MIALTDIEKSFDTLKVLKGVSLCINRGEIVSIVGPSGAGKTTLLQIMGTLLRPDRGRVVVSGEELSSLKEKALAAFRNRHMGFVFQQHRLLPEFTAMENVMLPALIGGASPSKAKAKALQLLQMMQLQDRAEHKPAQLSGGEQQRVSVARALVNSPAVVLADEPSGSLDSKNKEELHNLFFTLREQLGQTFVIVTHDEQLSQLTDRRLVMKDGQLCS